MILSSTSNALLTTVYLCSSWISSLVHIG